MPVNIKVIGKIGNALLALIFAVLALVAIGEQPGVAVFFALLAALGAFNFYVLNKAARVIDEDEQMLAEAQQKLEEKPKPK